MAPTQPIKANFMIVKVEEDVWDVLVFGSAAVLKAFRDVYGGVYVEESSFNNMPVCVMPNFENKTYAETWKEYWVEAFRFPEKACKTCQTVNDLFSLIEKYSNDLIKK